MISLNIRSRLTLWYLLITGFLIVLFGFTSYFLLETSFKEDPLYPGDILYSDIGSSLSGSRYIIDFTSPFEPADLPRKGIIDTKVFQGQELLDTFKEGKSIDIDGVTITSDVSQNLNLSREKKYWFYAYLNPDNNQVERILVISQSNNENQSYLGEFRRVLSIITPITLIIAGVLGFFLVNKCLRPLHDMASTARQIEEHNLAKRLIVTGKDELGHLAITINKMLQRLENAFKREKQFTADASHELRAPLAVIQSEASLCLRSERSSEDYKSALENIYQEADRMSSMVNRLLFLARHDAEGGRVFRKVDLSILLEDLISDIEWLCEEKELSIVLNSFDGCLVQGDDVTLRQLFFNLIDNAIHHTPRNGQILVTVHTHNSSGIVTIQDTGEGIPQEHLDHIFERFYRVDKSRSRNEGGAGLGLAICQRIIELHEGSIEVTSKFGEGSTFSVSIPLSTN